MNIGNRVYYKKDDGSVIFQTGEMSDATNERSAVDEIGFIDVPFGSVDYTSNLIIGVDVASEKPILKTFNKETEEQRRIRELEDAILMQSENEIGGIL